MAAAIEVLYLFASMSSVTFLITVNNMQDGRRGTTTAPTSGGRPAPVAVKWPGPWRRSRFGAIAHTDDFHGVGAARFAYRLAYGQHDQVPLLHHAVFDQHALGLGE